MISLEITPAGQGMDTNTMIFLSVYFVCMAAVLIAFILRKKR
jgi:hypothetical protein